MPDGLAGTVEAYNNAFALSGFQSSNPLDFIARPDGGSNPPIVPEPVSSALFITGGALFGSRRSITGKK